METIAHATAGHMEAAAFVEVEELGLPDQQDPHEEALGGGFGRTSRDLWNLLYCSKIFPKLISSAAALTLLGACGLPNAPHSTQSTPKAHPQMNSLEKATALTLSGGANWRGTIQGMQSSCTRKTSTDLQGVTFHFQFGSAQPLQGNRSRSTRTRNNHCRKHREANRNHKSNKETQTRQERVR